MTISPNQAGLCDNCAQPRWLHPVDRAEMRCPTDAEIAQVRPILDDWTKATDGARDHYQRQRKHRSAVRRWVEVGKLPIEAQHAAEAEFSAAWLGYQAAIRSADKDAWIRLLRDRVGSIARGEARLATLEEASGFPADDLRRWAERGSLYDGQLTDCDLLVLASAVQFSLPWPGWDVAVQTQD